MLCIISLSSGSPSLTRGKDLVPGGGLAPSDCLVPDDGLFPDDSLVFEGSLFPDGGLVLEGGLFPDGTLVPECGLLPDGGFVLEGGLFPDGTLVPEYGLFPNGGFVLEGGLVSDGGLVPDDNCLFRACGREIGACSGARSLATLSFFVDILKPNIFLRSCTIPSKARVGEKGTVGACATAYLLELPTSCAHIGNGCADISGISARLIAEMAGVAPFLRVERVWG